MNKTLKVTLRLFFIFVLLILMPVVANAQKKAITVQGTNTYPEDVNAVQTALDQYDVVTLSGIFNFGQAVFGVDWETGEITGTPAGIVYMTRPKVVLKADEMTGATIAGGGAPFSSKRFEVWPVIGITAADVTVRGLVMYGSPDTGIFFLGSPQTALGKQLTIEGNTISADYSAVMTEYTAGLRVIVNRNQFTSPDSTVEGARLLWFGWTSYTRDTSGQLVPAKGSVEITNNEITMKNQNVVDGILVWGWGVGTGWGWGLPPLPPGTNLADWGDNGPITISGNVFTMDCPWCTAIQVGRSDVGANHVQVVNNTFTGTAGAGIDKWPYGRDNVIARNDLKELTTLFEQIGVMARGTIVDNNVLGPVIYAPGLLIYSVNFHPSPDPLDTPMPLPVEYCHIFENDYRVTGLPGWPQGGGAILLASEADAQWYGLPGTEVRYNFIAEIESFPDGTGPNEQVYQLIVGDNPLVHDNWILGLSRGAQSFDNTFQSMAQERVWRLQNQPWKGGLGTGKTIGPRF